MTWPSTNVPATAPTDHGDVRTQAYQAGGGDYFRSGYYSHGLTTGAAMATRAEGVGGALVRPFLVPVRRAFDRIGVNVSTAATAASGGVVRMGIYANDNGIPGALIVDGGTVSSETTGAKEVTISVTLDPGLVWVLAVAQVATCTLTAYAATTVTPWVSADTAPVTSAQRSLGFNRNTVTGALPTPFGTPSSVTSAVYAVSLRAA